MAKLSRYMQNRFTKNVVVVIYVSKRFCIHIL